MSRSGKRPTLKYGQENPHPFYSQIGNDPAKKYVPIQFVSNSRRKMFHPGQGAPRHSVEMYTTSGAPDNHMLNFMTKNKLKNLTHQQIEDENLAVGFRGSDVKERKRTSFDMFEPKMMRNVKFSKKYYAQQHKNHSSFNAYKDYVRNMKEFNRSKELTTQPDRIKKLTASPSISETRSFRNKLDLSPGKLELTERELEKMALQGMFDYPHNRVNNQLIENIDLKQADKKYYEKFKAFNKKQSYECDLQSSNYNRYRKPMPLLENGGIRHNRSYNNLDVKQNGDMNNENNYGRIEPNYNLTQNYRRPSGSLPNARMTPSSQVIQNGHTENPERKVQFENGHLEQQDRPNSKPNSPCANPEVQNAEPENPYEDIQKPKVSQANPEAELSPLNKNQENYSRNIYQNLRQNSGSQGYLPKLNNTQNGIRVRRPNRSTDLNQHEIIKYFESMKRRDPILAKVQLPESEYSYPQLGIVDLEQPKPNSAGFVKEMHQIHAKTFTDHHLYWKNRYPRPFK